MKHCTHSPGRHGGSSWKRKGLFHKPGTPVGLETAAGWVLRGVGDRYAFGKAPVFARLALNRSVRPLNNRYGKKKN